MRGVFALVLVGGCGFHAAQSNVAGDGGIDAEAPPTIGFAEPTSLEDEESGAVLIPVVMSTTSSSSITIAYRITGGSATNGVDYTGSDGTLTFSPGELQQAVPIEILMDPDQAEDETIVVQLDAPTGGALLGTATHTLEINSDILPRVRFTQKVSTDGEGTSQITLNLALDRKPTVGVNVPFTVTGTATQLADHTLANGSVTFMPNEQGKTITLPIVADQLDENDETVIVTLNTGTNVVLGPDRVRTHTIIDDDPLPIASFMTAAGDEGEADTTVQVTVRIDPVSGRDVTIPLLLGPSSGTAGADFNYPTTLSVTIPEGQQSVTFALTVLDDDLDEEPETAIVQLAASPTALVAGTPTYTLTIVDEDPPPTVQFDPTQSNGETRENNPGPFAYRIQLGAPSGRTVTVNVGFNGSDATQGSDYQVTGIPVTFAPGETVKEVVITVIDDNIRESSGGGREDIQMTLSGPSNATLGPTTQRRHRIQDDDN